MNVADYVMNTFVEHGGKHVFTVPGGHCQYLSEAADFHPELEVVYFVHEQAAAVAAEGYYHASKRAAMVLVTAGPGVLNAISGVAAAYLDAVPMLVISGQMKRDDLHSMKRPTFAPMLPTLELVKSITDYVAIVTDQSKVKNCMTEAMLAVYGGPVWLDIPLDIQSTEL